MSLSIYNNNTLVAAQQDSNPIRIGLTSAVEAVQAVVTEAARATAAEGVIAGNLTNEVNRATAAEALKAPLASPALTGIPTAPTAATGTNTTQIANTAFVAVAAAALRTEMRAGRVYTMTGSSPSGLTVPADYSVDLLVMQQRPTNTMTYWRYLNTAPDPAVETETVKLDAGGTWWTLVADPAIAAEVSRAITAEGLVDSHAADISLMQQTAARGLIRDEVSRATAAEADLRDEDAAIWGRQSDADFRSSALIAIPNLRIGMREIEPEIVSYDLCVTDGRWADTGLPWSADGRHDGLVTLPETITDNAGSIIVVTLWSYDLCPLSGYYRDSGVPWPSNASDTYPPMVVKTAASLVTVYMKAGAADRPTYIRHPMEHYVDAARNIDVWRTNQPSEATRQSDGSFLVGQKIIQNSEVDTAIKLTGRIDFSGGKMHGNEEMTSAVVWLVDGVQIDPSAGLTYAPHRLELIQKTQLYDPGTATETQYSPRGTAYVELTKRHRWQDGEYGIRTHVRELVSDGTTVNTAFFLMVPIMRLDTADDTTQITHTAARSPYYDIEDVSAVDFTKVETTSDRVLVWGDRYAAEWRAIEGWSDASRLVYVDNRAMYNKIYPGFFRNDTFALTGAEYDVESAFRITIQEPMA